MTPANTHTTSPGMVRYPRIARIVITLCAGCTRVTLCRSRTSAHTGAPKRAINIGQKTRKCRRSLQQLQKKTSQGCKVAPETPPSVRPSRTSPKNFMLLVTSILLPPMICGHQMMGPFEEHENIKARTCLGRLPNRATGCGLERPVGEHPAGVSASVVEPKTRRQEVGKMGRTSLGLFPQSSGRATRLSRERFPPAAAFSPRHRPGTVRLPPPAPSVPVCDNGCTGVSRHHRSISYDHKNTCCR